jgi:signal transduction histidine kinase
LRSFGIKVNTSFKNLPELIQADELRVKEMIFHILNNAIKFNKERKGEIDIFVEGLEEKAKLGGKLV